MQSKRSLLPRNVGAITPGSSGLQACAVAARLAMRCSCIVLDTCDACTIGCTVHLTTAHPGLTVTCCILASCAGPENTPYCGGCFLFDIYFPPDYPRVPPKVLIRTTGSGSVRVRRIFPAGWMSRSGWEPGQQLSCKDGHSDVASVLEYLLAGVHTACTRSASQPGTALLPPLCSSTPTSMPRARSACRCWARGRWVRG